MGLGGGGGGGGEDEVHIQKMGLDWRLEMKLDISWLYQMLLGIVIESDIILCRLLLYHSYDKMCVCIRTPDRVVPPSMEHL